MRMLRAAGLAKRVSASAQRAAADKSHTEAGAVMRDLALDWRALTQKHPGIPAAPDLDPDSASAASASGISADDHPSHAEETRRLLAFWAAELGIGLDPLMAWRALVVRHNSNADRKGAAAGECGKAAPLSASQPKHHEMLPLVLAASQVDAVSRELAESHRSHIVACARRLRCVISPFVGLGLDRNGDSQFVARRKIPAGMFLLSLPQQCAIVADASPPTSSDDSNESPTGRVGGGGGEGIIVNDGACTVASQGPALRASDADRQLEHYFTTADDLAAQVLSAAGDPMDLHHEYAVMLQRTAAPPRNLCFLDNPEAEASLRSEEGRALWSCFHRHMRARPLCPALDDAPSEIYLWALSHVLARRMSSSLILPLLDKLNHPAATGMPNCYYTLASERTFCGVDVVDNLFAGVEAPGLYEPHAHLFAIDTIPKGAQLTISYSDADPCDGGSGHDLWLLNYGFRPKVKARLTERDLQSVASVIAERRIGTRAQLFPPHRSLASPSVPVATSEGTGPDDETFY